MASSGNLVHEVLREALVPAARPIDHARRIGTGAFLGSLGGSVLGIVALDSLPSAHTAIVVVCALAALGALCLVPWMAQPKVAAGVEVVARVLGTNEAVQARRVRGGRGVYVPVACRPVGALGSSGAAGVHQGDFRAVVIVKEEEQAVGAADVGVPAVGVGAAQVEGLYDPAPGMLMPLLQVEAGMGELAMMPGGPSDAQRGVMEYLRAHPKSLSNTAPVLPLRRSPLERVPAWAAAEFWASAILGAVVALLIVAVIAG